MGRPGPSVDVVLPCRDEAAALPAVLARIPAGWRAIVVDNGSTDGSADVARRAGALVVHEPRPGYGSAVHAGLAAATADIVAVMDCDGSVDAADLEPLARDIVDGRADLAVGRRRPTSRRAMAWHVRWGNRVVAAQLRRRTGAPVHDLAPVRVGRRVDLLGLGVADRRSGYPVEALLRATTAGWRIVEHDIQYHPRHVGTTSKIAGSLSGTVTAVFDMGGAITRLRGGSSRRRPTATPGGGS